MPDLDAAIAAADARRITLDRQVAGRRAELPLRYWCQAAHLTAPAERRIATKALTRGTAPMGPMMERLGIEASQLADRLGVDDQMVTALLAEPRPAPLVVIDAEDAMAPTDEAAARGRVEAVEVLSVQADGAARQSLRFYRPPGIAEGTIARELTSVLWGLVERHGPDQLPLDGIVLPKIDHPEEIDFVHAMLSDAEAALGIPPGSIRTAVMVESAAAINQLEAIAGRAVDRLCALIFGLADYSADLGLPTIDTGHAVADWARARIVNVAAAVGVPAIDGMTLSYPVADASMDAATAREHFLDRVALVYEDALRAQRLGMSGKWVGHPAQLFAALLASDARYRDDALERAAMELEAYGAAIREAGAGVTIIGGDMADRATDRHSRVLLRRAVAAGRFDPGRALALGVIDEQERQDVQAD